MAESGITDETVRIEYHAVALLDVLGQKDAISKLATMPTTPQERQAFIRNIQGSLGVRDFVRDSVLRFLEGFQNSPPSPLIQLLHHEHQVLLRNAKRHLIGHYEFSDTVVAYAPMLSELGEPGVHGIYAMLCACASTMLTSMAAKVPLRGAIAIGVGIPAGSGELYGPGFLCAYELESTIAQWPRIVIADNVVEELTRAARMPRGIPSHSIQGAIADSALSLIFQDRDGAHAVDYAGPGMAAMAGRDMNRDLFQRAARFAIAEFERFTGSGAEKLVKRYEMLKEYLDGSRRNWRN